MSRIYLIYTDNDWSANEHVLLSGKQVLSTVDSWGSACISAEEVPDGTNLLFTRQDEKGNRVYFADESFQFNPKTDKKWALLNNGDWIEVSDGASDGNRLYKIFLDDEHSQKLAEADPSLYGEFKDYYELCKRCADYLFKRICVILPELANHLVVDESFAPADINDCHCELCNIQLDPRT